jgi:hypothetical protein
MAGGVDLLKERSSRLKYGLLLSKDIYVEMEAQPDSSWPVGPGS